MFMISWVNPTEKLADKRFDDYMLEGPLAALDAIEAATGEKSINAIGYFTMVSHLRPLCPR